LLRDAGIRGRGESRSYHVCRDAERPRFGGVRGRAIRPGETRGSEQGEEHRVREDSTNGPPGAAGKLRHFFTYQRPDRIGFRHRAQPAVRPPTSMPRSTASVPWDFRRHSSGVRCRTGRERPRESGSRPGARAHRRTVGPAIPRLVASPQSRTRFTGQGYRIRNARFRVTGA
jgi:hypothetical protein